MREYNRTRCVVDWNLFWNEVIIMSEHHIIDSHDLSELWPLTASIFLRPDTVRMVDLIGEIESRVRRDDMSIFDDPHVRCLIENSM